MARLTITLSDERHRALKEAAAQRGRSIGELIEASLLIEPVCLSTPSWNFVRADVGAFGDGAAPPPLRRRPPLAMRAIALTPDRGGVAARYF